MEGRLPQDPWELRFYELAIKVSGAVQAARVHLAIPKPTVFLREKQKPSASVMVSLYAGRTLDKSQVAGIVHLVASAIEG